MTTLTPKFKVGDRVKTTRSCPNDTYFYNGQELVVSNTQNDGRYIRYAFAGEPSYHKVTERNLELVKAAPEPKPVVPFEKMTKEQLAERVVETAKRYAKDHDWCDVVNDALKEMGLEDFTQPLKRRVYVTLAVEVDGDFTWDEDDYLTTAREEVSSRNATFQQAVFA